MTLKKTYKVGSKTFVLNDANIVTKREKSLLNVYRNFGLKTPGCYGYIGVYHTQFSVAYFLVSTLLSKMFDVGDRDLPVPTSGN